MDFEDVDDMEQFLKDNMAEGWLSQEENKAIEEIVEEVKQLRMLRDEYLGFEEDVQENFEVLFEEAPFISVM